MTNQDNIFIPVIRWYRINRDKIDRFVDEKFPRLAFLLDTFYKVWYIIETRGHDEIIRMPYRREVVLSCQTWSERSFDCIEREFMQCVIYNLGKSLEELKRIQQQKREA